MNIPDLDLNELSEHNINISLRTGLSLDYYNEFSIFNLWYLMMNQHPEISFGGITGILGEFLIKRPGWRIQKYSDFYGPQQSYPPNITQIYIQKGGARIPVLDGYIDAINTEIDSLEKSDIFNEKKLKKAWNEAFFLVHGNRKKQI